jgi:hypothetical protein
MNGMDIIHLQMTGKSYCDKFDNGHTLITDDEESGSGRMGALPYDSDDEDDNFNGLWGLPPGLFPATPPRVLGTPPRVPGLLNQRAGLLNQRAEMQAHLSPGTDEDDVEEPPQLRRSSRLHQIQQQNVIPKEVRNLDTEYNKVLHQVEAYSNGTPFNVFAFLSSNPGEPANLKEALSGPDRNKWIVSLKAEFMNFISRKAWKKVSRHHVTQVLTRRLIYCMLIFKIKTKQNKFIKCKTRIVSQGYM